MAAVLYHAKKSELVQPIEVLLIYYFSIISSPSAIIFIAINFKVLDYFFQSK